MPEPFSQFAEWLWMVIDSVTVFFASTLKQVTRNPGLVASALGAFSEYLEFPLACGHFSVNAFYVMPASRHKSKCSSMHRGQMR